jgi:hypothetical protein
MGVRTGSGGRIGSGGSKRLLVGLALVALLAVLQPAAGAATVRFPNVPVASWRPNGVGRAVLLVGNTVYVGGDFGTVRNPGGTASVTRRNLAAFDATTGALLTTFRADTDGVVRALATDGVRLYVGGQFTHVNGTARSRLAAVDLRTGAVAGWSADVNSNVYSLGVGGGRLYVGGAFSSIRGQARANVGAVDLASGSVVASWHPNANGSVYALAVSADGGRIYLGGSFTQVAGASSPSLARVDAGGGRAPITWRSATDPVFALALRPDGTRLAVAFAGVANAGAYYDTSSGARLWSQRCDGDGQAIEVVEDSVFVGHHEGCNGDHSVRLMSWNAANGARDTAFRPTFDRFYGVWAIDGTSSTLAIAGDFTRISGVAVQGFALFRR